MTKFEIYFYNLNEDAQKAILNFYGISSLEEANLDILPLAVINTKEDKNNE